MGTRCEAREPFGLNSIATVARGWSDRDGRHPVGRQPPTTQCRCALRLDRAAHGEDFTDLTGGSGLIAASVASSRPARSVPASSAARARTHRPPRGRRGTARHDAPATRRCRWPVKPAGASSAIRSAWKVSVPTIRRSPATASPAVPRSRRPVPCPLAGRGCRPAAVP